MKYFGTELFLALKQQLQKADIHFKEPIYRGDLLLGIQTDKLLRNQKIAEAIDNMAQTGTPAFKAQAHIAADNFRYGCDAELIIDEERILVRRSEAGLPFGLPAKLCYDIRIEKPTHPVLEADDIEGAILSATINQKLHEDVRIYVREKNAWNEFASFVITPDQNYSAIAMDNRIALDISAPYNINEITAHILHICQKIQIALRKEES